HADAVQHRLPDQGARRQAADADLGRVHGPASEVQGDLRARGDAPDERDHGAHDHPAPARRAGARAPVHEEAPGARRADPEEGARRLPQPLGRNPEPAEAARQDLKPRAGYGKADGNWRDLAITFSWLSTAVTPATARATRSAAGISPASSTMPARTSRPASPATVTSMSRVAGSAR